MFNLRNTGVYLRSFVFPYRMHTWVGEKNDDDEYDNNNNNNYNKNTYKY